MVSTYCYLETQNRIEICCRFRHLFPYRPIPSIGMILYNALLSTEPMVPVRTSTKKIFSHPFTDRTSQNMAAIK